MWIPSHIGVPGNERADNLAKTTSTEPTEDLQVPGDVKTYYKSRSFKSWQTRWSQQDSKLHDCEKTIKRSPVTPLNRKEQISLRRLRIGHTAITHKHHLEGREPPLCTTCNHNLTVKHMLVDCPRFEEERRAAALDNTLKDVLDVDSTSARRLFRFLSAINVFNHI